MWELAHWDTAVLVIVHIAAIIKWQRDEAHALGTIRPQGYSWAGTYCHGSKELWQTMSAEGLSL